MNRKELIDLLKQMYGEYLVWKAEKIVSGEYYRNENKIKDKFFGRYADKILRKMK